MRLPTIALVAATALTLGCNQKESTAGCVDKSSNAYTNSFDFVWESSLTELKDNWKIASENRKTCTITTCWKNEMSPFASQGRRDRLVVTIVREEKGGCGYRASVKQQTQTNASEEDPLHTKDAKWEDIPSDGGLSARFLQNLDTRLQPDERWRDRQTR